MKDKNKTIFTHFSNVHSRNLEAIKPVYKMFDPSKKRTKEPC